MDCIGCGGSAGYNRAVVSLEKDAEIGGLCRGCESTLFGQRLELTGVTSAHCFVCTDESAYALPLWYAIESEQDDIVTVKNTYSMGETTPCLCADHYTTIAADTQPNGSTNAI